MTMTGVLGVSEAKRLAHAVDHTDVHAGDETAAEEHNHRHKAHTLITGNA
jgi:hypothetical protein